MQPDDNRAQLFQRLQHTNKMPPKLMSLGEYVRSGRGWTPLPPPPPAKPVVSLEPKEFYFPSGDEDDEAAIIEAINTPFAGDAAISAVQSPESIAEVGAGAADDCSDLASLFGEEDAADVSASGHLGEDALELAASVSEADADHESVDGGEGQGMVAAAEISAGVSAPAIATRSGLALPTAPRGQAAAAEISAAGTPVALATSSVPASSTTRQRLALPWASLPAAPAQRVAAEMTAARHAAATTIPALPTFPALPAASIVVPQRSASPESSSPAPKKRRYEKKEAKDKPFTFRCRFATSQWAGASCLQGFASVDTLRNHMARVHQLFAPGSKRSEPCGFCRKQYPGKQEHSRDVMCHDKVVKFERPHWVTTKPEEMSPQELADTFCLSGYPEPLSAVKQPNEEFVGERPDNKKRKASAVVAESSRQPKRPRATIVTPPTATTPAYATPEADDDCVITETRAVQAPTAGSSGPQDTAMQPQGAPQGQMQGWATGMQTPTASVSPPQNMAVKGHGDRYPKDFWEYLVGLPACDE